MNEHDAKFHLRAMRPNGADAADPMFAEPLAEAARDPKLQAWLERERAIDAMTAAKLAAIAPPAGLREAILAGARASSRGGGWWRQPWWLAAAAGFAVLIAAVVLTTTRARGPSAVELAQFAANDLMQAHDDHVGFPAELADVQARLSGVAAPMSETLKLDVEELRRNRCRSVRIAGHEVFEICFPRDGAWYHLYVMRNSDRRARALHESETQGPDRLAIAAWSDARNSYALVTNAGREALRRLL